MSAHLIAAIVLEGAFQLTRDIQTWDRLAWWILWAPDAVVVPAMLAAARGAS